MQEQLNIIRDSISLLIPELVLTTGILLLILLSLFSTIRPAFFAMFSMLVLLLASVVIANELRDTTVLFDGMIRKESFTSFLKLLINAAGILTGLLWFMTQQSAQRNVSEYFALILTAVLSSYFLMMSQNFVMIFLSLETISISSYVLAGYAETRAASEGSLKYFLFGSAASAIMLYGLSILYGLTGSLDFYTPAFFQSLRQDDSPLFIVAGLMVLAGFLYKTASAPMHLWAPDAYEASPIPVLAFLSTAPKLAGIGILAKSTPAASLNQRYDWQMVIVVIAMLTLTVGNFAALAQQKPKRMMAYSAIAQSGFLLIGIVALLPQGIHSMLFYASIYVLMNFTVLMYLQYAENQGLKTINDFSGAGKQHPWPMVFLLIGLIALTGLPPTSGFTAKLLIFSSLWESYQLSAKPILLWLLIFGLLNTVVSLFYYLKIPYYAFLKNGDSVEKPNNITFTNFLGLFLVLLLLVLFFMPGLLMGWINKINFVF